MKLVSVMAVLFLGLTGSDRAQQNQNPLGGVKSLHATDFASAQYFEPPNDRQVKIKLSGTSAEPLPGGALDIKNLKIETFTVTGQTQAVLRAAQCTYALMDGVASSPGHLEIRTGDGKMRTTGDGFLWRQSDNSLTISNHVHTVVQMRNLKLNLP